MMVNVHISLALLLSIIYIYARVMHQQMMGGRYSQKARYEARIIAGLVLLQPQKPSKL